MTEYNEKKSILFCGNGMSAESIKFIKEMGYLVYLITDFINDPGTEYADKVEVAVTKDPSDALRAARNLAANGLVFNGVLSLCWDCAVSVAVVAEEFNLRSVGIEVAKAATIKSIRSIAFNNANIPAPEFRVVRGFDNVLKACLEIGFPVVIKPLNLSSSKGVILVEKEDELRKAYEFTSSFSPTEDVIVNEFISGTEHSTEGLMIEGKFYPTAISDREFKYSEFKPYFVEVGDIMPTKLSLSSVEKAFEVTMLGAQAVGIMDGVVKGDLIACPDGKVKVLEIAARLGGPRFGTEMVPLSNGTEILKAAVQQAVGDAIDINFLTPKYDRGMVNRSLFLNSGKVKSIKGLIEASKMPGYYDFKWWSPDPLKVGDFIDVEDTRGNIGYLIAYGATRDEAINNADNIESKIEILVDSN